MNEGKLLWCGELLKSLSFNVFIEGICNFAKVTVKSFESYPYLTGVTAAQLQYLSNLDVIFNIETMIILIVAACSRLRAAKVSSCLCHI